MLEESKATTPVHQVKAFSGGVLVRMYCEVIHGGYESVMVSGRVISMRCNFPRCSCCKERAVGQKRGPMSLRGLGPLCSCDLTHTWEETSRHRHGNGPSPSLAPKKGFLSV